MPSLLCGVPVALPEHWGTRWRLARGDGLAPRLEVRVRSGACLPPRGATGIFDGPRFWVGMDARGLEFELSNELSEARVWARWDRATSVVEVCFRSPEQPDDSQLLNEVLPELLVVHLGPFWGGAYLHASGTEAPDGVRLFLGPSGRGKSTAARLLGNAGERIFAVDRCVAFPGVKPLAAAAPWHGGHPGAGESGRLSALFVLNRVGPLGVRRLSGVEALAALTANAFLPRWWPEGLDAALGTLERVARDAPVYALCSEPDHRLVARVRRVELAP
jgi:hypothetical protein